MKWYLEALKKYAVFSGRSRRKEYWYFVLFNILIGLALAVIDGITVGFRADAGIGIFRGVYLLAILIPSIAVAVRRLHDTDRSGWWLLIVLVPFIGVIVLLMFMVENSKPGENKYGPEPRSAPA